MPDLTEEEYAALDKKWTENPPKPKTPADIIGEMVQKEIKAVL